MSGSLIILIFMLAKTHPSYARRLAEAAQLVSLAKKLEAPVLLPCDSKRCSLRKVA